MKPDLYQTLEVSPRASDEEIKRAYRKLALLYHPDRNHDGAEAEERFKEAGHAYSILGDKEKKKRYDLYRKFANRPARWGVPLSPTQEKILEEIFLDPRFPGLGKWLEEILKEKGLADGGHPFRIIFKTTLQVFRFMVQEGRRRKTPAKRRQGLRIASFPKGVFRKVRGAIRPLVSVRRDAGRSGTEPLFEDAGPFRAGGPKGRKGADIEWVLPLTREEAAHGTRLTLSFFRDSRWDRLSLRVPPGTRQGVRLRIRNKGNRLSSSGETGDLYLRVMVQ